MGLILVVLTLGIILIFKPTRQLFYKDHVSIKLVKPIWLPTETTLDRTFDFSNKLKLEENILDNIDDIKNKNLKSKNIQIFTSRSHVFSLSTFPGWIFKTSFDNPEQIIQKSTYIKNIKQVCKQHNFDHLIIPEFRIIRLNINGKSIPFIVERILNIDNEACLQENLYTQYHNDYKTALTQLVHLICQTDLHDITWETCPLIFDNLTNTFSKIALIGLKPCKGTKDEGLFGNDFWNRRGIIRCVPPKHFPTIKSIISKYNKNLTEYQTCVQKRLAEVKKNYL